MSFPEYIIGNLALNQLGIHTAFLQSCLNTKNNIRAFIRLAAYPKHASLALNVICNSPKSLTHILCSEFTLHSFYYGDRIN